MNDVVNWADRTFSDEEVELTSGLSVRSLRSLGSADIIHTATLRRGRGQRRTFDHSALGRAILVGGINDLGFSLDIAAAMIAFAPLEDYLIKKFTEKEIIKDASSILTEDNTDLFLDIVDGAFGFISNKGAKSKYSSVLPFCFGRITEDEEGDYFETWIKNYVAAPAPRSVRAASRMKIQVKIIYTTKLRKTLPPEIVAYMREREFSRKDAAIARRRFDNPRYYNSLNLSMALRVGKARLLGIDLEL